MKTLAALAFGVLSATAAAQGSVQIRDVAAEGAPEVHVIVRVLDAEGRFAPGIPVDRFKVFEDGSQVGGLQVRQTHPGEKPVALSILIDTSGSMVGDALPKAVEGAKILLSSLAPEDSVQVIDFGKEIRPVLNFGDPVDPGRLDGLTPQGDTPLHDALVRGLTDLTAQNASTKALVVLTDGRDDGSSATFEDVLNRLGSGGIPVHAVGLRSPEFDPAPLQQLASTSGGSYLEAGSPADLREIYRTIAGELRTEYRLTFSTRHRAGTHRISVFVESDGVSAEDNAEFALSGDTSTAEDRGTSPLLVAALVSALVGALLVTMIMVVRRRPSAPAGARAAQGLPASGVASGWMLVGEGGRFPLVAAGAIVGRDPRAQIVIEDPSISRTHARLDVDGWGVWVEDLGSANGTMVNGRRITREQLQAGDTVQFGQVVLELWGAQ